MQWPWPQYAVPVFRVDYYGLGSIWTTMSIENTEVRAKAVHVQANRTSEHPEAKVHVR